MPSRPSALTAVIFLALVNAYLPNKTTTKFSLGEQSNSVGVTATNLKILISAPKTNAAVTEFYVELTKANSKLGTSVIGGLSNVTGTYGIYSKLCLPTDPTSAKKVKTIQVLTHGGTLDHTYWDLAPGYSYVDQAVAAGYATYSYDRLGTGLSDHPDPVQIVQLPTQIEIAHILMRKLRAGEIGDRSFQNVVGVGHSLGSAITQAVAAKYPKDLDALILQGTSTLFTYAFTGVASEAAQIANTDASGRFKHLADGYHTPAPIQQAIQFAFYRYPGFDQKIFDIQVANKQTNDIGETFTLGSAYAPATAYTGPVDIVNGQNDYFYCGGDCTYPGDQAAAAIPAYFPAASKGSQSYLAPNAGHNINAHYSSVQALQQMIASYRPMAYTEEPHFRAS